MCTCVSGPVLVREYQGEQHTVTVVSGGYVWCETTYASLCPQDGETDQTGPYAGIPDAKQPTFHSPGLEILQLLASGGLLHGACIDGPAS